MGGGGGEVRDKKKKKKKQLAGGPGRIRCKRDKPGLVTKVTARLILQQHVRCTQCTWTSAAYRILHHHETTVTVSGTVTSTSWTLRVLYYVVP